MSDNTNKISLVDKLNLAAINKSGQIPENMSKKPEDKVYISKKESDKGQESTSQGENINVLFVYDANSKKTFYSADEVKRYDELRRTGNIPEGFSIRQKPIGEYIKEQFSTYQIGFEQAIKSNGNQNLGLIALYITKANENNNRVALGKMVELIKGKPNFDFAFNGGTLDLQKLKEISQLSEKNVTAGVNALENDVKRDISSRTSVKRIIDAVNDKLPDKALDKMFKENAVELVVDPQKETNGLKSAFITIGEKIGKFINDTKVHNDNNSLENIFARSSLSEIKHKDNEEIQLEDKARLEKERIAKERELEKAKARESSGKKLTPEQQKLLEEDRALRIRMAEKGMKENNSFGQYILSNEQKERVNAAGIKFVKEHAGKEGIKTGKDKDTQENLR